MLETLWVGLIALCMLVPVNLLLTLRIIHWISMHEEAQMQAKEQESLPELQIGVAGPDFKAHLLSGERVDLTTYAGKAVVFLFLSPRCESCRAKVFALLNLHLLAQKNAHVEFVFVSDCSTAETYEWVTTLEKEERRAINIPVVIAPRTSSDFMKTHNPRGLVPYYCFLDEQGIVKARGPLGSAEWLRLQRLLSSPNMTVSSQL